MQQDTIFALSTPPGKSGIAVIRISGVMAADLLLGLTGRSSPPPTRQAILSSLYAQGGTLLDRALVLYFKAPHSFTGEDVVELHVHGGAAIIRGITEALGGYPGVRAAEPGEFMRRAFFAGKADLLEAEAIADMIDAETSAQLSQAVRQMQGQHSKYYKDLRGSIIEILALLEAYIDFPEEEIPDNILSEIAQDIKTLRTKISASLADGRAGERIRSGFRISIMGAPNVGKSTLLNALAGRDAAIVSAHAGTTRDLIELHMDIAGYAVVLCDTAGLREASDEVERLGIERSHQSLAISDMSLLMVDAARPEETSAVLQGDMLVGQASIETIVVINKADCVDQGDMPGIQHMLQAAYPSAAQVIIAAKSQENLEQLELVIKEKLGKLLPAEDVWITRARHRDLLARANGHLSADAANLPLELYCEEIRLAAVNIGKITGEVSVDELLDVIFSRFCIGK